MLSRSMNTLIALSPFAAYSFAAFSFACGATSTTPQHAPQATQVQTPGPSGPPTQAPAAAAPQATWTQAELERISREISVDIEEIRGEKFVRPVAVRLAGADDLMAYFLARMAKTETPTKLTADENVAKLLGVIPPEMNLIEASLKLLKGQVAGFYDPDSDSFSLMDTTPMGLARITMAHELDHALDDQLFDIDGSLAKCGLDTDAQLAFQAVVEGSGTAVMNIWTVNHIKELDTAALAQLQEQQSGSFKEAPAWLWKPMLGVYMQGAAFLQRRDDWVGAQMGQATAADIRRAFEQRPRSTEQVLHSRTYWNAEHIDEPRALKYTIGALAEGWSVQREDTLGEFMTSLIAGPDAERAALDLANPLSIMAVKFGNELAAGWDGDRLVLLGRDKSLVLRWTSVWDSPRDAGEFYGAMTMRKDALDAAAHTLGGKDSGVEIDYDDALDEVVLTVHVGVKKRELRDIIGALALTR